MSPTIKLSVHDCMGLSRKQQKTPGKCLGFFTNKQPHTMA
jgi:hypothetical protein